MTRRRRAAEPFGAIPFRAHAALERGDMTFAGWGLLCYLIPACFRNGGRHGECAYTLRGLKDATRFPRSTDTLSRELDRLRQEWIDYEVRPRQRGPYVFRLSGALLELTDDSDEDEVRQSEQPERQSVRQSTNDDLSLAASASDSAEEESVPSANGNDPSTSSSSFFLAPTDGGKRFVAPPVPQGPTSNHEIDDDCMKCLRRRRLLEYGRSWLCEECAPK